MRWYRGGLVASRSDRCGCTRFVAWHARRYGEARAHTSSEWTIEVDDSGDGGGSWDVVHFDLDAVLAAAGDADGADIEETLPEGLGDLDVSDVVVDNFSGGLAEQATTRDGAFVGNFECDGEFEDPPDGEPGEGGEACEYGGDGGCVARRSCVHGEVEGDGADQAGDGDACESGEEERSGAEHGGADEHDALLRAAVRRVACDFGAVGRAVFGPWHDVDVAAVGAPDFATAGVIRGFEGALAVVAFLGDHVGGLLLGVAGPAFRWSV